MKSQMCINVDFLAGTAIESAVEEAKQKALAWDVAYVTFNFNGASFSIGRNADVYDVVQEYHKTQGKPFGICSA